MKPIIKPATTTPTPQLENKDEESPSYADSFFGFEDINQNEAVVNLLVLLLQNINDKMDQGNQKTASILSALKNDKSGNHFYNLSPLSSFKSQIFTIDHRLAHLDQIS